MSTSQVSVTTVTTAVVEINRLYIIGFYSFLIHEKIIILLRNIYADISTLLDKHC